MNLAFSIVLLFTLLDCVTNESSLALKGCHVPLTAFYQPVKALFFYYPIALYSAFKVPHI